MTVFANKGSFVSLGLEQVKPSPSHASQDCTICLKPLVVYHVHASPHNVLHGYHDAVRISACGHIHGKQCLSAWLDVGNSCPTCKRILFEPNNEPITQQDVNFVMRSLEPLYGAAPVMSALVAYMQKQKEEHDARRRYHEQEVALQRTKDGEPRDDEFTLNGDDFLDTDEDAEGDDNFEDGDYEEDDADSGGYVEEDYPERDDGDDEVDD